MNDDTKQPDSHGPDRGRDADDSANIPATPPRVIKWFKVYAGMWSFVTLVVAVVDLYLTIFDPSQLGGRAIGVFGLGLVFIFFIANILPIVLRPRRWLFYYNWAFIAQGALTCFLPFSVFLMFYWWKPDVRRYFGFPCSNRGIPIVNP
jgi:hypothetical protein